MKSVGVEKTRRITAAVSAVVAAGLWAPQVYGASASWSATPTDGNWVTNATETNWSTGTGTFPGATSGTASTDTATFNSASTTTAVTINSPSLNVQNVTFDTAAAAYTIGAAGGNPLLLSAGGAVTLASTFTGTNVTETINAPLVLEGNYSLTNASATAGNVLNIGGGVSGASGATTLTLNGANTGANTLSGGIANGTATSLALVKSGAGTWTLGGSTANTFTGNATVNGGTLLLNNSGGLALPGNLTLLPTTASVPVVVRLNANNQLDPAGTVTINTASGIANGNNQLDLNGFNNTIAALVFAPLTSGQTVQVTTGTGTLTLNGNISINGTNSNPLTIAGKLALGGAGPNVINGTNTGSSSSPLGTLPVLTISAAVSGSNGLTQQFGNTTVLSGANTYTGPTAVVAGTLSVSSLGNDGEMSSSLGAATGTTNRTITLGSTAASPTSSGTLLYTGPTTSTDHNITAGATASGFNALFNNSTGTLTWTGSLGGAHSMFLSGTGTGVFAGPIGITNGVLHKSGTGTWSLTNATSTYTVPLAIDAGTLSIASVNGGNTPGVLGNSTQTVSVSTSTTSGTLAYTGATASTDRPISLTGTTAFPSVFQVGTAGTTLTLTGAVGGSGSLTKSGPGALFLSNNTYTGNTSVAAGTLSVSLANFASSSSVSVSSSAVLNLGFAGSDTISALTLGGTVEPPGTYNSSNAAPFLTGTGSLIVAAPEPASLGLLALSSLGLLARRRKRTAGH